MAAHGALGLVLLALLWWTLPKERLARWILCAAIALLVVAPMLGDFFHGFGATITPPFKAERDAMIVASIFVVVAMTALGRWGLVIVSVAMAVLLYKLSDWVEESWTEMCSLYLVWIGAAIGLIRRRAPPGDAAATMPAPPSSFAKQDITLFAIATFAATLVSIYVLQRGDGSADEWAYTWQAAAFAKGHAYAPEPACDAAFQSFYVFWTMGRQFSQYTPGWPFFMAPFVAIGAPWLAGPVAHGVMTVGIARVTRTSVRLDAHGPSLRRQTIAGWVAGLVATFGSTILLNGGSRFSHIFVAALYAWAIESLLLMTESDVPPKERRWWAVLLGACIALLGATRPADGLTLAAGLFVYFVYAFARRRIDLRLLLATFAGCAFWGGLTLIVLRLQLGEWFTTGYSLNKIIHPWNVTAYGWPRPNEWKVALPLGTGTYCWFPCSLAVGAAGVASLRRGARGVIVMLVVSMLCFEIFYQYLAFGRAADWGYGPRFELPFVVLMAVGTGVALAPLFDRRPWRGPAAVAVVAMIVGLVRIWPLLYPGIYAHVKQHDGLNQKVREMNLHHALVVAQQGTTGFEARDLPENLPITLYPDQDVLIAIDRGPDSVRCLRASYADRAFYRASGAMNVVIVPW
jgi:hypothetical protein